MRISRSLAGAAVLLALSAAPAAGQGRWIAAYGPTADPALSELQAALRESDMLETLTGPLNEVFRIPRDVTLELAECGRPAAFYDPARAAVQLCYELFTEMDGALADPETGDESLFEGAFSYVLLHQVGHAIVDVLELPTGLPAEEAADQFAAVMAAMDGALGGLIPGTRALHESGLDWTEPGSGKAAPSAARLRDLECLAYGSDPGAGAARIVEGALMVHDPSGCAARFDAVMETWIRLLEPYMVG